MLNPKQLDTIIKNICNEAPDKWQAGVQTILLELAKNDQQLAVEVVKLQKRVEVLLQGSAKLALEVQALTGGAPPAGGAEGEVPAGDEVAQAAPQGVPTVGVDGLPLSPEEIENERLMNAATSAPAEAPPPQQPQRSHPVAPQQQQRRARPPGAAPPRPRLAPVPQQVAESAGGTPLTREQAEIEAQMEAAAGPRPE